jgi:hypothetical protein
MRPRFLIRLSILVLVILSVVFWLRPKQSTIIIRSAQKIAEQTNQPLSNTTIKNQNISNTLSVSIPSNRPGSSAANRMTLPEVVEKLIESKNKPIEFYGKIIDQDSNPVPDAKVDIGIRHWTMPDLTVQLAGSDTIHLDQTSDANGRFEFHGATGDGFGVGIVKNGYSSPPNARYGFGPQAGTFDNPVILKMWKMGKSEKLISCHTLFGFQRDGRLYTLDLLNNKKIEDENTDGDLRIKFECPTIKPNQPYPWALEISAIGGGLIEVTDEFTYLAPEIGYQPQVLLQATSVAPSAVPDFTKTYYIKTRNGQDYGVVKMQIYSDYRGQSAILVDSRVNPNGSRNLQP